MKAMAPKYEAYANLTKTRSAFDFKMSAETVQQPNKFVVTAPKQMTDQEIEMIEDLPKASMTAELKLTMQDKDMLKKLQMTCFDISPGTILHLGYSPWLMERLFVNDHDLFRSQNIHVVLERSMSEIKKAAMSD